MVVFLIITSLLSSIAAIVFVAQVNMRVLCRTSKGTTVDTKMYYGDIYIVVLTLLFLAMMVIIGYLSKFPVVSCILALAASIALVMANTYLKGKKIHATLAMIVLWFGVFYASFKDSGLVLSFTTKAFKASNWWVKAYIVLQLICGALILVGTAVANYRNYYGINKRKSRKRTEARPDNLDRYKALLFWSFVIFLVILYAFLCVLLEVKLDFFPPYR